MLIVMCVAGAAALAVVGYAQVQRRSPETSTANLRAVRELAAVVRVLVKAVEAVPSMSSATRGFRLLQPPRAGATGATAISMRMNNDERQEEPTRGRAASGREDRIPIPV